jgi:hypothetical protein
MSKLQEVFERTLETKKEIKTIKAMYKDALANSRRYQEINEEMKVLKEKKKEIEDGIKDDFRSEFDKLEILKADLENDNMLLSDIAISKISKGERVEVVDSNNTPQEPVFGVKFKRKN